MKKVVALLLLFILVVTSFPLESSANKAVPNCNLKCFTSGTPVQTDRGFKPIEEIKVGDFVLTRMKQQGKPSIILLFPYIKEWQMRHILLQLMV